MGGCGCCGSDAAWRAGRRGTASRARAHSRASRSVGDVGGPCASGLPRACTRTYDCRNGAHQASSPLHRPLDPATRREGGGSPTFVTKGPRMAISLPPQSGATLSRRLAGTESSPVRELLEVAARPEVISLAGGLPAPDTFDVEGLAEAFAAVLAGPQARRALQYSRTEGDPRLREQLSERFRAGGLPCTGADVLITTGSQQALGLIAAALLDPGDVVLVEDPTYLAALQSFSLADARPVAVPSDADG